MTEDRMGLLELRRKGDEPGEEGRGDVLRQTLTWLLQHLMEAEVSAQIGADRYERTEERTALGNGSRPRPFATRVGTLDLKIPKLRTARYFPGVLEPRRRAQQVKGGGGGGSVCAGGEHPHSRGAAPDVGHRRHRQE